MKAIFVSYSSKHRDVTRELVKLIEAQYGEGSVWWDHELESRSSYAEQIKAALEEARVVVVIWTTGALASDYVYAEATGAQKQGKLVNVRPADVDFGDIPEPFNIYHIDNLVDGARILATIARVMTGTPIPTRVPLHEIYSRQHGRPLIDPKQSPLARDPLEISPSQLLQAKFEVVGYLDTSGVRENVIDWCVRDPRKTAGCVIHGPGGTGKTRLLIDVAKALRQQGWMAGFLDRADKEVESTQQQRWQALDQLIAHGEDRGLLLVIDYAESRQAEVKQLALQLAQRPDQDARPIRLALLGRSASEWWTSLHDETPELQRLFRDSGAHPGVIALPTVSAVEQRRALFEASRHAFAPYLAAQGYIVPKSEPSRQQMQRIEEDDSYARPLAIQIEALLWLASATPQAGFAGVDGLLRQVLGLERAHWTKLIPELDEEGMRDMARAVAQVTVVHGTPSRSSAERLLMADEFYKGQRTARVAVDREIRGLLEVFGAGDEGVDPMEPDLIGEHHVVTVADVELIDGCIRWSQTEPADQQARRRRSVVTVLQRATHPEHGARAATRAAGLLDHLIETYSATLADVMVAVMIETPGVLIDRVQQHVSSLEFESLRSVSNALPTGMPSLLDLSCRVAARLVDLARERVARPLEAGETADERLTRLAKSLDNLSTRLADLGRPEQALEASVEAVDLLRPLSQSNAGALPDLARSLINLTALFSSLARPVDALRTNLEAFNIYLGLPDPQPDAVQSDLAAAAANLGICLGNLGEDKDAADAFEETVRRYRDLAHTRAEAAIDLATSLNNLAISLSNLGRDQEALAASQEAVDLYRRVASTRPDAFLPSLAASLDTLGNRLARLARIQEALAACEEAVGMYRRLDQIRPDVFLAGLAKGLSNLALHLADLGRQEEAFAANREGIAIFQRLEHMRPGAFLPDLAKSLAAQAVFFETDGRPSDALESAEEAIRTLTPRFLSSPETLENRMRSLLREHARFLKALGKQPDEALLGAVVDKLASLQNKRRPKD